MFFRVLDLTGLRCWVGRFGRLLWLHPGEIWPWLWDVGGWWRTCVKCIEIEIDGLCIFIHRHVFDILIRFCSKLWNDVRWYEWLTFSGLQLNKLVLLAEMLLRVMVVWVVTAHMKMNMFVMYVYMNILYTHTSSLCRVTLGCMHLSVDWARR